jgi:zinc D-Ala-D-Ala carboxypeptidase
MKLTQHFTLDEFTISQTAVRNGWDNIPPETSVANLARLAQELQKVRDAIGKPMVITSGYRNKRVNAAVGGVEPSSHETGCAADIIVPGMSALAVCLACMRHAGMFNKIIWEFKSWCHFEIALPETLPQYKLLTIDKNGTRWGFVE